MKKFLLSTRDNIKYLQDTVSISEKRIQNGAGNMAERKPILEGSLGKVQQTNIAKYFAQSRQLTVWVAVGGALVGAERKSGAFVPGWCRAYCLNFGRGRGNIDAQFNVDLPGCGKDKIYKFVDDTIFYKSESRESYKVFSSYKSYSNNVYFVRTWMKTVCRPPRKKFGRANKYGKYTRSLCYYDNKKLRALQFPGNLNDKQMGFGSDAEFDVVTSRSAREKKIIEGYTGTMLYKNVGSKNFSTHVRRLLQLRKSQRALQRQKEQRRSGIKVVHLFQEDD